MRSLTVSEIRSTLNFQAVKLTIIPLRSICYQTLISKMPISWAIKLTELKRSELTSLHKKPSIQFRQNQILKNHGIVTGGFTKNATWLNAFSIKSNIFVELRHAMTSWHLHFMPLFTLPRSGFYQNDQHFEFSDTP